MAEKRFSLEKSDNKNIKAQKLFHEDEFCGFPTESSVESVSETDTEQDPFHGTDDDDSDYVLDDNSGLNSTTDSTCAIAVDAELNQDLPEFDEIPVVKGPTASKLKKNNKVNKNLGKEYVTHKNKTVPAKKLDPILNCNQMCHKKINIVEQNKIFKTYWNLGDYSKRRQYLCRLIDIKPTKTVRTSDAKNPRNRPYNFSYHFEINGQRNKVCKNCFLKIFGESDQSIKTIIKCKLQDDVLIQKDLRGKHAPNHKLTIDRYNEILTHINSIPKYQSHYSRRHSNKIYFHSSLNLTKLYELYTEKCSDAVSVTKYREVFNQLDLKFKKPQIDLCTTCETLRVKIKNSTDEVEKAELLIQQKKHHDEADYSYKCKKNDKNLSINDQSIKMFSFDLQQCLPTPHLNASVFFYKRPLWTFNFTMHDGATNKADCFIWNETIAKRGANDIASCIYKCLLHLPENVKHVILYSDSCPGQNRNSYVCAMFEKVLEDHPGIEVIDHKFLVVGHTHLECDTVHAQIEKKKKNSTGSIQHPHDWVTLIAATNRKYIVHELQQNEFYDFHALLKNKYTWRTNNVSGKY